MARQDFLNAEEIIQRLNAAFDTHTKVIAQSAEQVKKYQAEFNKLPSGYIKAQKELLDLSYKQARSEKELANSRNAKNRADQQAIQLQIKQNQLQKTDIQLTQAQAREKDRLAKAEAKAMAELQKAESFYGRVNARVRELSATYYDLALKKQMGQKLNATEEAQLLSMEKRLLKYNTAIDAVNTRIGRFQQRVGNYATGTNAQLSMAIGQFSRELPNLGISVQTFAMSLSNQFGQLQDAIKSVRLENAELISQGKPVKSVFSQIMSSIFSLNTALYLGIAAFTAFSPKIFDWISGIKDATKEVDLLREAVDRYNNTIVDTVTNTEKQQTNLNRLVSIMKDENKEMKERIAAAKELQGLYPGYLENLTQEELTLGASKTQTEAYIKAMRQLKKDIDARVDAESKQNAARENLKIAAEIEQEVKIREQANDEAKKAIDNYGFESAAAQNAIKSIRQRIAARKEMLAEDQEFISKFGEIGIEQSGSVTGIGLYTKAQITELALRAQDLRREYEKQAEQTNEVILKTSLLDYKADKDTKDLKLETLKDFEASAFALNQQRLENEAAFNKEIFENEKNGYADREHAATRYGEIILELAQLRREEELRLLKRATKEEIDELKRRAKEGEIAWSNANEVIKSLEKQSAYDRELIYENYSKAVIDANAEISKSLEGVWKDLDEQERKLKQLELHNNNLRQAGLFLDNVDGKTTAKQFAEIENQMREIQKMDEDSRIDELRAQREVLGGEIEKLKNEEKSLANNKALNDLLIQQKEIDGQILDIELKRKEAVAGVYENMRNATNEYLQGITSGALADAGFSSLTSLFEQTSYEIVNELGEIETKTGSVFDKLFDQAGTMQEKFAVTFNAIAEVAQEAFNFINQASQANFEAEYARLAQQKDIALKYAGESATAREEIERQYQERQREIKMREWKANRDAALFNIAINTAQGITAALASVPPNPALAIAIGVIGAAQAAIVASREIPSYFKGTDNHPGGLMMVNDAKGSNYMEMVHEPGKSPYIPTGRNQILNAPKGTKVFTADKTLDELNKILISNDIAPFADVLMRDSFRSVNINNESSGISEESLLRVMKKVMPASSTKINVDRSGFGLYTLELGAKTKWLNGKINITTKNI